ncbi:unnamed protein product [Parascedosporium putredinis]|uniref:Uncharacterized protein n=1 Tax=Parascedosporium putredinis TaxID=1442378 RepID=A0A9P1GZZ4_9PEZI|nr:unnamed protein product [Parascedosporium putredinis]CAI7991619.1 unnamed protein product [Parascedosporium putredinis]
MEQFEVADDASSGTGRDVDSKRKAVVTYERVQLIIRVPMLLFGYGVLALWLYIAIRWNQEDGARQNLPDAKPLGEVNMWFGIPIVCSLVRFSIIFDTWDIVALSSPTRTRARPGILLTHELLNIITMTCGVIFGYRSSYNEEYFDLAKSDNERYPLRLYT